GWGGRREEARQVFDRFELGLVPVALAVQLAGLAEGEARARRRRLQRAVLAGEEAARQRVVHDDAQTLVAAERQQFGLDVPEKEVVARLHAVVAGQPAALADPERQRELPRRVVRAADVTDLALPYQVVEGPQAFFERRVRVGRVGLVEVDVVGAQAAQAVLHGLEDVAARQALVVGAVADAHAALGGQDDLVPAALQP